MPFFPSFPDHAGPPALFKRYPDLYEPWAQVSQELMNGDSPLSPGTRELVQAYAAAVGGCEFVARSHAEVAYAWGIEEGLVPALVENLDGAPVEDDLRELLRYLYVLVTSPGELTQEHADAVLAAGWDERALHDAIAVCARAAFMSTLVQGHGFIPPSPEDAASHARRRVERGYVNVYRVFAQDRGSSS